MNALCNWNGGLHLQIPKHSVGLSPLGGHKVSTVVLVNFLAIPEPRLGFVTRHGGVTQDIYDDQASFGPSNLPNISISLLLTLHSTYN